MCFGISLRAINCAVSCLVAWMVAALQASAVPQDQMFFTDFEDIVPNTSVGQPFEIGEGLATATFAGDAFAGFVGVTQLYHSGVRAWMVNPQGTGTISFSTSAAVVEFFARPRGSANGNTVITAFDDNNVVVGAPVTLMPPRGFQLVSFTGSIARVEVRNLATGASFLNGVDDFGFTPLDELPPITGDYNNNGAVEQGDLDLVLLNWGADAAIPPAGWVNDPPTGAIDQAELDGVLLNWGSSNVPAASASLRTLAAGSVPEPSALGLVVILATASVCVRRRF